MGMDRASYDKLAPLVTALPRDTKLNICTAPGEVLDAISGQRSYGLDPKTLTTQRQQFNCYPDKTAFLSGITGPRRRLRRASTSALIHSIFGCAPGSLLAPRGSPCTVSSIRMRSGQIRPDPQNLRHGISMAEWLILRMPRAADAAASWLVADPEGRPLAPVQSGPLEAAGRCGCRAARRRAGAAPPTYSVWTSSCRRVPARVRRSSCPSRSRNNSPATSKRSTSRSPRRACRGPYRGGRRHARSLDGEWLARLAAAGITPELLCTDAALMPRVAGHAVALLEGDTLSFSDGEDDAR